MSTDNRTMINDCEANTGWAGDDTATAANNAGEFYEDEHYWEEGSHYVYGEAEDEEKPSFKVENGEVKKCLTM